MEETQAPATAGGLHDLLISMLAAEVEELLHRGPARRYIPLSGKLESPRGRILVQAMAREGGLTEARLPCGYFERHVNWDLNQVLQAGLDEAAQMTDDRDLRRHIHKLGNGFVDVEQKTRLETQLIDRAQRSLTRLTEAYSSALSIIRLLHNMQGLDFGSQPQLHRIPGFLFDMNSFFQHLLSRFFHENLRGHHIVDESPTRTLFAYALHANPKKRRAPALRPDYSLFRGNVLRGFLDAKYRDVWEKDLPAEWLYQLAVYALASPNRVSILLYGCMAANVSDQQVDIRIGAEGISAVIIRPVPMMRLSEMVQRRHDASLAAERSRLAEELVLLRARSATEFPASETN